MESETGNVYPCPVCGEKTDFEFDCPGYTQRKADGTIRIVTCYPPCGNALYFFCTSETCSWWFRTPNKRLDDTMGQVPVWLGEAVHEIDYRSDDEETV